MPPKVHRSSNASEMLALVSVLMILVLPNYLPAPLNLITMGVGGAFVFTLYLGINPDSFRSRNGSLTTAYILAAFLWIAGFVTTAIAIYGR